MRSFSEVGEETGLTESWETGQEDEIKWSSINLRLRGPRELFSVEIKCSFELVVTIYYT